MEPSEPCKAALVGIGDGDGWVLASTGALKREVEANGTHSDDVGVWQARIPAGINVWEGSLLYHEDETTSRGEWRKPNSLELVALRDGLNPWEFG